MATLVSPHSADLLADAKALRKACEGWGTKEKGVIEVIGHRTYAQLSLIKEPYLQNYNEDLIQRLEKELSGDFEQKVYVHGGNQKDGPIELEVFKTELCNKWQEIGSCSLAPTLSVRPRAVFSALPPLLQD